MARSKLRRGRRSPNALLGRVRTLASVGVFQAHNVVELRRRHFDDVHVRDGDHPMDRVRRAVEGLARSHSDDPTLRSLADLEVHFAGFDEERFVFFHVVLPRKALPCRDMKNLSDVTICLRPHDLVAPRFADASHAVRV